MIGINHWKKLSTFLLKFNQHLIKVLSKLAHIFFSVSVLNLNLTGLTFSYLREEGSKHDIGAERLERAYRVLPRQEAAGPYP